MHHTNERHPWEKDRARAPQEADASGHDTELTVSDQVFSARYSDAKADEDLANAFGVPVGTPLLKRVYATRYEKEEAPFSVIHSYLVRDHIAGNPDLLDETKEPWPGGTQHQLMTVGIEVDRVVETIREARPPSREEAKLLGMRPGMAVIIMRRTLIDTDNRVVEVADLTLPGDRTQMTFVTPLARW